MDDRNEKANNNRISFNELYSMPSGHEDVWQLRKNEPGETIELQNRASGSTLSLDSWTQTVMTSRSSLASSMASLDSAATGGMSSANTTPGASPLTQKRLPPSLKLNLDEVTWTTSNKRRRRHKYKKNIQASGARVRAVIQQSRNPQFRIRFILLTLFGLIVSLCAFTWHLYQRQLMQVAVGDRIRFHEGKRTLYLLGVDGRPKVEAHLGDSIPRELGPHQCSSGPVCEEWKFRAQLRLNFTHFENRSCYHIQWNSLGMDTIPRDCIAMSGGVHWYGMGLQRGMSWPLGPTQGPHPLVTGEGPASIFGGIVGRYWLSSDGVALLAHPDDPLYVAIDGQRLCLEARNEFPYQVSQTLKMRYTLCTGHDMLSLHQEMVSNRKTQTKGREFLENPIWVFPESQNLTQESVQEYANGIMEHTSRPGFLLFDSRWQHQEGTMDFNKIAFPSPKRILKILRHKGFRVLLTIHPYICLPSRLFERAVKDGHIVSEKWKNVPLITRWHHKLCGLLDLTNNDTNNWFSDRLLKFKHKNDIDGFMFAGGQSSYLPRGYVLQRFFTNPDLYLPTYLSIAHKIDALVGTETGYRTQDFPGFVRLAPRTVSWDNLSGLGSVIPEVLTLNLLGYSLVNPGSVGGVANGASPELFIRWVELSAFLPVIQFSHSIGDLGIKLADVVQRLLVLRQETVLPLFQEALEAGLPLVRPLWWVAPTDKHAHTCETQFLVGDRLMVAPVLEEGKRVRDIYLPIGWWHDHLLGEVRLGGKWLHNYPVPLMKVAYFSKTNEPI